MAKDCRGTKGQKSRNGTRGERINSILVIFKEWYDARYSIFLVCTGFSSLAFFVIFMENRQYNDTRKKQRKLLEGYDFAPAYFEAVQKHNPEVSNYEVAQAYEELRAYFCTAGIDHHKP